MSICIYCISILQISLGIMEITNNIVNLIDFYDYFQNTNFVISNINSINFNMHI